MERKTKACWSCYYYKAFYTKGFCCFDKQEIGLCRRRDKILDKHETCECWQSPLRRKEARKRVSMRKLDRILEDICAIRQILFEDKKENDEP